MTHSRNPVTIFHRMSATSSQYTLQSSEPTTHRRAEYDYVLQVCGPDSYVSPVDTRLAQAHNRGGGDAEPASPPPSPP